MAKISVLRVVNFTGGDNSHLHYLFCLIRGNIWFLCWQGNPNIISVYEMINWSAKLSSQHHYSPLRRRSTCLSCFFWQDSCWWASFVCFHPSARCFICLVCVGRLGSSLPSPNISGLQLACLQDSLSSGCRAQIVPRRLCFRWGGGGLNAPWMLPHNKDGPLQAHLECRLNILLYLQQPPPQPTAHTYRH